MHHVGHLHDARSTKCKKNASEYRTVTIASENLDHFCDKCLSRVAVTAALVNQSC